MELGQARFEKQIERIYRLIHESKEQENPAFWLYLNDLRTPLFMIEGLARLYAQAHNRRIFSKIQASVKKIEDAIGALDEVYVLKKMLDSKRNVSKIMKEELQQKLEKRTKQLHKLLKKGDWLNDQRLKKISSTLTEVNWKSEQREQEIFREIYFNEISDIQESIRDKGFEFVDMEKDVHELRRDLRWLSIYPQALDGFIELVPLKKVPKNLSSYLTKVVMISPFNQLTLGKGVQHPLFFRKEYFLALSWMISDLGRLKDLGLTAESLYQLISKVYNLENSEAWEKTYSILGKSYPKMGDLLDESMEITHQFFENEVLDHLVI